MVLYTRVAITLFLIKAGITISDMYPALLKMAMLYG
jgi:hypothetical protein